MSKSKKSVISAGAMILGLIIIFALIIYFMGFGIASGILKIFGSIPMIVWIFILIVFFLFAIGGKKR